MHDQTTSAPALYRYDDQTAVRVVTIDAEPWFVLGDLTRALGIAQFRADRLDEGWIQNHPLPTAGGVQSVRIVSEPGMYEVVLRSDKPEAVGFRRWLTGTVLPEIRKTASYNAAPALTGPELMALALQVVTEQAPKDWIYRHEESRWSNAKGKKEIRYRYSEKASHKRHFRRLEVHEAPRFRGEVMHTLKATPQGAEAIARLIAKEQAA